MEYLYDMHCHLLPGIDDGASDEYEMIKMVHTAYDEGIRTMFATPHYHPYRGSADAESVMRIFGKSYSLVKHYFPDMDLYEGCEIYYISDIVNKLKQGELLTLAGSNYALIEFDTGASAVYIRDALSEIEFAGFYPILAHIERYDSLIDDVELIGELVESGVYVQINAGSVLGNSGNKIKKNIINLLREDLVHFVGTDAHDNKNRAPHIKKCARMIEKKFGEDVAERIFHINPEKVIKNKII